MSKMILCTNSNGGIGYQNTIPWHSSADFKHFKEETTGKIVVMGYKTWKSLPRKPLPGRMNIVLVSRDYISREEVDSDPSVLFLPETSLRSIIHNNPDCVIMGGARIYKMALPYIDTVVLSIVDNTEVCDTFFKLDEEAESLNLTLELASVKVLEDSTMVEYWSNLK
ncbi:dihydrofolate reductase [Escherichia phage EJP2]|nr:dihydrofolate reductase [Escherichia phage EJP2]